MSYDLVIVGAGPAGIFTALELIRKGSKRSILMVEKGSPLEKRHCPKPQAWRCVNCRPIATSPPALRAPAPFGRKLSLSHEVGGSCPS